MRSFDIDLTAATRSTERADGVVVFSTERTTTRSVSGFVIRGPNSPVPGGKSATKMFALTTKVSQVGALSEVHPHASATVRAADDAIDCCQGAVDAGAALVVVVLVFGGVVAGAFVVVGAGAAATWR